MPRERAQSEIIGGGADEEVEAFLGTLVDHAHEQDDHLAPDEDPLIDPFLH
jgi:hypothetical protein